MLSFGWINDPGEKRCWRETKAPGLCQDLHEPSSPLASVINGIPRRGGPANAYSRASLLDDGRRLELGKRGVILTIVSRRNPAC